MSDKMDFREIDETTEAMETIPAGLILSQTSRIFSFSIMLMG